MKKLTFEEIENSDLLLYKYIRGSHAYGLQKPDGTSDIDTGGVYLEPIEHLIGLGLDYQEQITDEKHDNIVWSLKRFFNLLLTSNPAVLEALFIPEDKILYEHPIMTKIKSYRDMFVTKECFKPFLGYGRSQILKARGLNKKIVNPMTERKGILDFAYTFKNQGSQNIQDFFKERGLLQKYVGLVNIPNMHNIYGVYYDWGQMFRDANFDENYLYEAYDTVINKKNTQYEILGALRKNQFDIDNNYTFEDAARLTNYIVGVCDVSDILTTDCTIHWWHQQHTEPQGYKGMIGDEETGTNLRLSSVVKGEKPICFMCYNEDGYKSHCKKYREYKQWERDRNPERYKENCEKDFDRKNIAHAVRLLHMGIEIAKTGKVNVDRTNIDRDFIMGIRLGNTSYDEIIEYLASKEQELKDAISISTLPETIDRDFVNNLLLEIRKQRL